MLSETLKDLAREVTFPTGFYRCLEETERKSSPKLLPMCDSEQ